MCGREGGSDLPIAPERGNTRTKAQVKSRADASVI